MEDLPSNNICAELMLKLLISPPVKICFASKEDSKECTCKFCTSEDIYITWTLDILWNKHDPWERISIGQGRALEMVDKLIARGFNGLD